MADLLRDKTLALAAVFQAAALADSLAWRGSCDPVALEHSLSSVLVLDTDEASQVFGSLDGLQLGLRTLENAFAPDKRNPRQNYVIEYALSLIQIERHLAKSPEALGTLRRRLEQAQEQLKHFEGLTDPGMLNNLGHLYVDTIGTLSQRIQIKGDPRHLQGNGMAEQIRAALLSGVRAAWLWHRLGGRRWHLIFTRKETLREIHRLALEGHRG